MTDEAKALVERLRSGRWLGETTCGPAADLIEALETQLESANEALRERLDICETQAREIERLRRDRDDLLTFAKAIQIWRSDADSYDRECDHPQRNYCEDVELMEGCADIVVRRVTARAALAGDSHAQ